MEKRELKQSEKKGISLQDLLLTAVLLAAGAVLKFFVGTYINLFGMKPNFIIAMYCMAIVIIRPKIYYSLIIGLIAGAICQFYPGTPYLNFASEAAGALAMGLLIYIPAKTKAGKIVLAAVATFISTVISGGLYTVLLFVFIKSDPSAMAAYVPIVLGTATLNAIIVAALYVPLMKAMKKKIVEE
ncbi:MAG: hypothetical protein IKI90_03515 [Treponema sp.]|nr:hypothetical protein [Treponema sp.]MBP5444000.1 hypothetical protein [Treponema sp.]MBR4004896.1 hypothetical protein [Treponema sp.]MBR6154351.1 hypothetical protein [Treponema sp.]